jgi:DNA polymerase-3 subunit epsilon
LRDFLAIDFETANGAQDSACAVGLVRVSEGKIVHEESHLIRPPTPDFWFTHIHGITWQDVAASPDFAEVWQKVAPLFSEAEFIAAHNASFDQGVLNACCRTYGIRAPQIAYLCTVRLARDQWGVRPTKLPDVCSFLGIKLTHHRADSDARACAQIVIAAQQDGWRFGQNQL